MVGRAYPPEFFDFIKDDNVRRRFQTMVEETETDYQNLISKLESFGVEVKRPEFPEDFNSLFVDNKWVSPPTAPRDYFIMIGNQWWVPTVPNASHAWSVFYRGIRQAGWGDFVRPDDFYEAQPQQAQHVRELFTEFCRVDQSHLDSKLSFYQHIFDDICGQGNEIVKTDLDFINGCFVSRIGEDLYFATQTYYDDQQAILNQVNQLFPTTRNRVVNAGGHGDAVYCPITPGLIISLNDVPTYADTFPDWEVIYLPPSNYAHMREFEVSMKKNKGRWFMPGFEQDQNLINTVDYYFDEWVGQVSETVFDVNILIVDPKNIIVSAPNDTVEQACARHGISMHVVPFRHKYFWDAGVHCATNDLSRLGTRQKFLG
jgi:hypothetical protein